MIFKSRNPWSGELIAEFESFGETEVLSKLALSRAAFTSWKEKVISFRLEKMDRLMNLLRRDADMLAFSMSEEMGKTITEARAEVQKSITLIDFNRRNAESWLAESKPESSGRNARLKPEPLGGILLVMPWNFPLWQVIRAAVPALCAGNVILLKHAPNVFRFSASLQSLFLEAGFPEGVFQEFRVDVNQLELIVSHEAVAAVSLTGSEAAGRSMAALAGKHLKKCVLELGGSDPFIVMKDADLSRVAGLAAASRMINNGQSCIAAKRFLVHHSLVQDFSFRLLAALSEFRPGNPCLAATRLGPLARPDLVENLLVQKTNSVQAGARLVYEMKAGFPEGSPFFLPVLLADVKPGMPAFDEETFGPLACISTFYTEEEAVSLANNTRYGLGASVHSGDEETARRIASRLQCGTVAINTLMRSDPALPFGGIRASGFGKEMAEEGMKEFCNLKVIMKE